MTLKKKGLKKGTLEFLLSSTGLNDTAILQDQDEEDLSGRPDRSDTINFKQYEPGVQYASKDNQLLNVDIEKIQRSPYQPRRQFSPESLQELSDSIKSKGLIQPIVVRRNADNYELIAGERRWRAAQMAGLHTIPVVIKEVDDETALVMAIVENIQRQDLNPIEEARGLQRLITEFAMTQQQVSEVVGKARTTITNLLRLLGLNQDVQKMLENSKLEMGHARALLPLTQAQQYSLANKIISKKASVRDAEFWARELSQPKDSKEDFNKKSQYGAVDPNIKSLQLRLSEILGANITINHEKTGHGRLIINYYSLDELDGIIAKIN